MNKLKLLSIVPIILLSSVNAETYKIKFSETHKEAISVEDYVSEDKPLVCSAPLFLNETKDSCVDPIEEVNWIDTSDSCGGLAQSHFNPRVVWARSKSAVNPSSALTIPKGYRWLSSSEWKSLYDSGNANSNYTYHNECGSSGYPTSLIEGESQGWTHFSNGHAIHTGHPESTNGANYTYSGITTSFLGYVLYKED